MAVILMQWHHLTKLIVMLPLLAIACTSTDDQIASTSPPPKSSTALTIWWDKGFTLEEDEALRSVVDDWEKQTGTPVELSFYPTEELPTKTQRAMEADYPPDIVMSITAERVLNPRLAWQGKLADLTDVLEPMENLYPEAVLQTVALYNHSEKRRRYYAVPIHQSTIHIFYWKGLLQQAGQSEADIPQDWYGFWSFWTGIQDRLGQPQTYGLGLPFSTEATDTYYLFEQILEAYNVKLLNPQGQLLVDNPQVRQGIIDSLRWYARFYQKGYVPPSATHWLNADNNRCLLNREAVMTPNTTLSIPAAVRQDPETYHKLGIAEFPLKPDGSPMRYLVSVRQAVVFADSVNQQVAKDFLTYLITPEVNDRYLQAAGGRHLPVLKPVLVQPFWSNRADPHLITAARTLTEGQTRPFYSAQHPAYGQVLQENVWGKALVKIVTEGVSPEAAADQAIARIKEIFDEW